VLLLYRAPVSPTDHLNLVLLLYRAPVIINRLP
jgi:hypothetical protein